MERWYWMTLRAYLPSVVLLLAAIALSAVIAGLRGNVFFSGVYGVARVVPLVAIAAAVAHATWVSYRLWRAERGEGLLCECGGLLGAERDGRYGPYRRCLACSRNVAQRYYEH